MTSQDATSLPELRDGVSHCDTLGGPMIAQSGQGLVLVSPSAPQENMSEKSITGTLAAFFDLIDACRPAVVLGEQVASSDVIGKIGGESVPANGSVLARRCGN